MHQALLQHHMELKQFGFKNGCILWGKNEGILVFRNYDRNKRKDMEKYVLNLMREEAIGMAFEKLRKDYYVGVCQVSSYEGACRWLDVLLCDYNFKNRFGIQGSKEGKAPKMKITLFISNSHAQQLENSNEYL